MNGNIFRFVFLLYLGNHRRKLSPKRHRNICGETIENRRLPIVRFNKRCAPVRGSIK